jgi:hypothetical protein
MSNLEERFLEAIKERNPESYNFSKSQNRVTASACASVCIEEMRKAFEQSRLTHPMVGFKYDTFEDYLKSLQPNE